MNLYKYKKIVYNLSEEKKVKNYLEKVWEKKLEQHKKDTQFAVDYLLRITEIPISMSDIKEVAEKNREFIIKNYKNDKLV